MDSQTAANSPNEERTWETTERINNENWTVSNKVMDLFINEGLCISRANQIMELVKRRMLERPLA
ncbi:hypothetical protein [Paenibacillus sp. FSL L8-0463]|uniref:hypothetical protein n=1 Tax=Paenibacillus sp. FSL L8-0463 TaxID=2954687 RepID=UPI00311A9102